MALRPCLTAGCPALTSKTRCAEHQRGRDRARNVARADEMQFYSTAHWRRLRDEVVRVGRCHWCGATDKRLVADHVRPVSRGGARFDPSNLVASCYGCNNTRRTRDDEHG